MSIQLRALLQTIGIITGIAGSSVLIAFVMSNISYQTAMYLLVLAIFGIGVHLIYGIVLGRLQYQETLDKISQNKTVD